jgi:hypothetical protein
MQPRDGETVNRWALPAAFGAVFLLMLAAGGVVPARGATVALKFNFQPASSPVPAGYQADSGAAWSDVAGFGWVRQDSLGSATHVPLDITPNTRDRNVETDQRLDTLVHMQYPLNGSTTAVTTPAAWEVAVPSGSYTVTVAVGDPVAGTDPENHVIHVEGQTAIAGYVPSGVNGSATRHATATVTVTVSDGRLTVDAIGGTNTKLDYIDIATATADTTPPAVPANVQAQPGDSKVQLSWTANTEGDLAGYNVYRSTFTPVATTSPLNASLLTAPSYSDTGLTNGTAYFYVVEAVDTSGNKADAATVSSTPTVLPTSWHINFQPAVSPVPTGYTVDSGLAWTDTRGFGWVRQDSLGSSTHVPLDISPNTRDRNIEADQRTDTLIHMQYPVGISATAVTTPAAWELAVPNGTYTATVTVGDPLVGTDAENHVIHVEGQTAIGGFVPSGASGSTTRHFTSTVATTVSDGRLTIDAIGGTNTKLDYVDIVAGGTPPPPPPTTTINWSTVAAAPIGRHEGGSAVVGGKLYAFGGYTDNTFTPTARVDAYDPSTNTWQQRANLPVAATHMGVATDGTDVYFAGGYPIGSGGTGQTFSTAAVWKYSPSTDTWSSLPDLPAPRGGGALALVGRVLHFFGGSDANRADATTHWTLNVDTGTAWATAAPFPVGRNHMGAVTLGGKVYAVAGQSGQDAAAVYTKSLDAFDPVTGAWTSAAPLPTVRSHNGPATFVSNGDIFTIGGEVSFNVPTDEVDIYDPVSNAWGFGTHLPVAHDSGIAGVINGTIYYSGGNFSTTTYKGTLSTSSGPPAPPAGVTASAGDGQVSLSWTPNSESDLAGYNVYRSTSTPVATTTPLNSSLLTSSSFLDTGLTNGTTYYYVVEAVDTASLKGQAPAVSATPSASTPVSVQVNFQDQNTVPPTGYARDFGEAYGARTGANQGVGLTYGWVVPGTATPINLVGNGRNRNNPPDSVAQPDLRLATFVHMQYAGTNGIASPGSWELAVPSGVYDVTVGVGDASPNYLDSVHRINIEGQLGLYNFAPTTTNRFATVTRTVPVTDGRLTIDAFGGTNTKIDYVTVASDSAASGHPYVTKSSPVNAAVGVGLSSPVTTEVSLPHLGAGVDPATLSAATVRLTKVSDGSQVPANLNTTGGGDAIILQPAAALVANTTYRFDVTAGVKDLSGSPFLPWSSTFTTGTSGGSGGGGTIAFTKVDLPNATGKNFTSLVKGPDGLLYASTLDGLIYRFPIAADGTLGVPQIINSVQTANGGPRFLVGMTFDPASTASNLIVWVTHSAYAFTNAPDWTGKISRLSGPNLATVTDYVVGLPRSIADHATNSLAFGPDGALYVAQGSNSSMGAPDPTWGDRPEHLLNAAILRVDTAAITSPPLNVQTEAPGTYDPFAAGAPLTLYATGLRNPYDLVWHSNGQLYAPTNGAAAGGNTPATPSPLPASCQKRVDVATNGAYTGPQIPALTNVPDAQDDFLFRVVKNGYYGHPDPARCEWVLNGGNPTAAVDRAEVSEYPVGTLPDRNWRGAAYDFGLHYSPDGAVEYRGSAFGGALDHALLITRYSAGDDLIALTLDASGNVSNAQTGLPGMTGFVDPVDVTEDQATGNLYVSEYGAQKITLLKPVTGASSVTATPTRLLFNQVQNAGPTASQTVTLSNTGTTSRTVTGLTLTGGDASQFQIVSPPTLPASIPAGGTLNVSVAFAPTSVGPKGAFLQAQTDDPVVPTTQTTLRGLGTLGVGGANEPSLQWIFDTWQLPINVGDSDPTNSALPADPLLGDEISAQSFVKAGTGPVTLEPLAVFGPQDTGGTVLSFGYYATGNAASTQALFTVPNASYQSIQPTTPGSLSFDPGAGKFGFVSTWPVFANRQVFSEDALNTWEPTVANRHKVRVYQLKTSAGATVPNAYVVAMEESTGTYDYNDVVTIVRNVTPAAVGGGVTAAKFNFQPAASPVPAGYQVDSGAAWSDAAGFGWVRQDSLGSATHVPLNITPNTRDRNVETDQRLDTLIHMQYPMNGSGTAVTTPAAWELAVPNGSYTVTVAVGDPVAGTDPENYVIHVEGQTAIAGFVPSGLNGSATRHATATLTVNVSDGRLTVDAIGGTNTKLDYIDIATAAPDNTPPTVSVSVSGLLQSPGVYANRATVTIASSDSGSGVASTSYSLDGGAFQAYTVPFDVTAVGSHTVVGRASDVAGNVTTTAPTSFSIVATQASGARITVQNLDGVPFDDRLVFSTIGSKGTNVVHDQATLRIKNTGTDPLNISGLPITGPWQLASPITLPATVAAGGQLDIPLKFIATSGRVWNGTLTVQSDDPTAPNKVVQLSGYWQSVAENNQEPTLPEIFSVMGYTTTVVGSGQRLAQAGFVTAVGDEVLSPYWQRVDATKPVSVRQLDAFHSQGNTATFSWFAKSTPNTLVSLFSSAGTDAQTLLPHLFNGGTSPAAGSFNPTGIFGVRTDGEISDPTLNISTPDVSQGCVGPCGHHVRFWPVKDRSGALVPNTYVMAMDYSGINYDYNDNVYLITNVAPAADGQAYYRLDAGGSANFLDSLGRTWTPDTGLFSPSTAIAEAGDLPADVLNTTDDVIYRTYRGNVGAVPLDQGVLTYSLPLPAGVQRVNVRLHFAERCSCDTTAGKRLFNVQMENTTYSSSLDIVAAAGAANTALVVPYYHVAVTDGVLTLIFKAVADYPSIAGIEVIPDP